MTIVDPITQLAARWQAEEERLYPALLFDEHRYEQAMLALRAAVDELQACATVDDLVAADQRRTEIVERAARRAGVGLEGIDPQQLAAAALRQRLAAVRSEQRRREAAEAIATARSGGGGWAILSQAGGPPPQPPYDWLAVHVPAQPSAASELLDGVHAWIAFDVDTDAPRFGAAPVTVELADGAPAAPPQPAGEAHEPDSLVDWQDAVARLRGDVAAAGDLDSHR